MTASYHAAVERACSPPAPNRQKPPAINRHARGDSPHRGALSRRLVSIEAAAKPGGRAAVVHRTP